MGGRIKIPIPLARGLSQGVDDRVRAPAVLTKATNAEFLKDGALTKRHGFTKLATTVVGESGRPDNQGNCKTLFSTGTELCIRGHRSLYTYCDVESSWLNRGPISPFTGELETMFHDQRSYDAGDTWIHGNYIGYIAHSQRQPDESSTIEHKMHFRSTTTDHQVLIADEVFATSSDLADLPHAPKMSACTGKLLAAYLEGATGASTATLRIYQYPTATPTTAPTAAVAQSNVWHYTYKGMRTYDIIQMSNGNYCYAYINHTTRDIEVVINDSTHSNVASATISTTDPYELVALDHNSSQIYVLAVAQPGEGTRQVELHGLADTNLASNFGPINLYTIPADEAVYSLGVKQGVNSAGATRVACTWTIWDAGSNDSKGNTLSLTEDWALDNRSTNTSGANLDDRHRAYNVFQRTNPFWEENRCYVVAATSSGATAADSQVILDLDPQSGAGARPHRLAGMYDVGVAPITGAVAAEGLTTRLGSANSVYETSSGSKVYRHMSTSVAYVIADSTTDIARYSQDRVEYDFAKVSTNAIVNRGCALIGGGQVDWYAGVATEELGYAMPPVILQLTPQNTGTGSLSGSTTYSYQVQWEGYDERGNWHRSQPSPTLSKATGAGDDAMDVTCTSLGGTNRISRRHMALVVYRSDADGNYVRVSDPIRAIPNTGSAWYCDVYRDLGTGDDGEVVYTQSGAEVGAIAPEGARIAMVDGRRVWLGGFYRRDRVQYSKQANPGTANEDAIAPEFNEAFSFILPSGKRCTGLARLDSKVVAFTADEVYIIAGRGPDDGGRNNDFSGLTTISSAAGCMEPRSVVTFAGGVLFQSKAGIYLLSRDLRLSFIGDAVSDELTSYPTITSAVAVPKRTQVRFTCLNAAADGSIVLVYDYGAKAWTQWEPKDSGGSELALVGGCIHNDVYYVLEADGTVWKEDSSTYYDDATQFAPMEVELSWLQAARQSGWQRVRELAALCARKDPHDLKISIYQDFETSPSQTYTWTEAIIATMAQPAVRLQPVMRVQRQKCTAIRARIEDIESGSTSTGQGYDLVGFMLEVQEKRGAVKAGSMQRN